MSLFHRVKHESAELPTAVVDSTLSPRLRHPSSAFAGLVTDPPELADEAYGAFQANSLTPGLAEKHVAAVLDRHGYSCLPVEASPGFHYEVAREWSDLRRLRVFCRYLVQLQFAYESNLRNIQALRVRRVKRVMVLPGCCDVCDAAVAGRRYRLNDLPSLPRRDCIRHGGCLCAYVPFIE